MARRIIAPKPSVEHVHQIQSTFRAMETSFQAKNDPQKILADEIEVRLMSIYMAVLRIDGPILKDILYKLFVSLCFSRPFES